MIIKVKIILHTNYLKNRDFDQASSLRFFVWRERPLPLKQGSKRRQKIWGKADSIKNRFFR